MSDQQAEPAKQTIEPVFTLYEVCKIHVEQTMRRFNGNKTQAARALGIDRRSLYRWLDGTRAKNPNATPRPGRKSPYGQP